MPEAPRRKQNARSRRRRWGHLTALCLLSLLLLTIGRCRRTPTPTPQQPHPAPRPTPGPLTGVTVIVDPGHGGADSGAIRKGVSEAKLTYRMACTVAAQLHSKGAEVLFTVHSKALTARVARGKPEPATAAPTDAHFAIDDRFVGVRRGESPEDLYRRAQLAALVWKSRRKNQRVYFLSLHYDTISETQYRGGLVCYDKRRSVPRLAEIIAQKLGETKLCGQRRATVKPRELGVLNPLHNPVPQAVLVELATISNAKDLRDAQRPAWRWNFAELLTDAIQECEHP